jgi:antitoxin ParD1/3/4
VILYDTTGVVVMASSYTLGTHFEDFVKGLVASGRYATASEVMRDGLRLLEERENLQQAKIEALRTLIQEGRDSGAGLPADAVLDRLAAKYAGKSPGK